MFNLVSNYTPGGDQPKAIKKLVGGYGKYPQQTLMGVTGSGKTFTMANMITKVNKPTLVLSHNKTLAAQLYNEFKEYFPENKVCYFVSYYDYYRPESYMPVTDTYIEKDMKVNEKIDQLRLEATASLLSRDDVIIVSSVSCIYGLGKPEEFQNLAYEFWKNKKITPQEMVEQLVEMQYENMDIQLGHGGFRVRGDVIEIIEGSGTTVIRFEFVEDRIANISELHPINFSVLTELDRIWIYPAKHYVIPESQKLQALKDIRQELKERLPKLGKVEAYRLEKKTNYDLEMIESVGYCSGIENYSRHFDGRVVGQPPYTLLDYFAAKKDFLFLIDESHVTLPQVRGMFEGDKARKKNLIDHGFRLPSAFDNRPLKFDEFKKYLKNVVYISATPADYELENSKQVVEQIIRPTGLIDPDIQIKPAKNQVVDVEREIQKVVSKGHRVLVTALTKRLAEDLSNYLVEKGIKAQYLHSEIKTLERTKIIKNLRLGKFDVLVGINLLREGLDIPEVAMVAILDADKEGFLRNARSLIQTIGRAARNAESKVILYADKMTGSIKQAIKETDRRRKIQIAYNKKHGIKPQTIIKEIKPDKDDVIEKIKENKLDKKALLVELELAMQLAAENLDFERAIELREEIKRLKSS